MRSQRLRPSRIETTAGRLAPVRPNPQSQIPNPSSRGFTLIEMLIVITIVVILVGMATTLMRPDTEGRRVREAARMINVYISTARNHAMETGRPCGVMLRRLGSSASAMSFDQCEMPAIYCGDVEIASATLQRIVTQTIGPYTDAQTGFSCPTYYADFQAVLTDLTQSLVHVGDTIRFGQQGPSYTIVGPSDHPGKTTEAINSSTILLQTDPYPSNGQSFPWPTAPTYSAAVPYRIDRTPVKCAAQTLQLPASTVVDMDASGSAGLNFGASQDIIILFAPNGAVQRVYYNGQFGPFTDPIFLLVGKRERVGNAPQLPPMTANEPKWANWQDMSNLWIVINPQTGLVTTEPVAAQTSISDSRKLALQAVGMGGK